MTGDSMTFGQRLTCARKKKGLTRKQLAELIGVKPNTVSHWVMGRRHPSMPMVQKIIKVLEVSEDWFGNDFKDQDVKPVKKLTKFGKHLAYARKKKGLSQAQLAEFTGLDRSKISHMETNKRNPDVSMLRRITAALGVSEDWFENDQNFKDQDIKPVKKLTNFGKHLAYARKEKGLSQAQLAKFIGLDRSEISRIETNERDADMSMIRRITTALGVSEEWFENDQNFKDQDSKLTNFGKHLAYTRKQKGLLQKQLAELIGVKVNTIGNWENNVYSPNASMIRKIITALGLSEDWFENDENFSADNLASNQEGSKLTKEQQQLVIDNEYIIYCVLKKYNLIPIRDDKWDIGEIGLCKAAQKWDEKKGVPFFTVAFSYIRRELHTEYRKEKKDLHPKKSLDESTSLDKSGTTGHTLGSLVADPDDIFERIEYKILVESVYQKVECVLLPREKEAFRYWLHGKKNIDIARSMGVTRSAVATVLKYAKNKCRTYFNADEIFS